MVLGGCGGYYLINVPDHLAAPGEESVVTTRLQRNDFFVMAMPVKDAAMRYIVSTGQERAAYTDKLGYAGTTFTAPDEPGKHSIRVSHSDREGEEVVAEASLYVWDPARPAVAVDLDSLPPSGGRRSLHAQEALQTLAGKANILYLTRRSVSKHKFLHGRLDSQGYPDGPVLMWQRQRWHIVPASHWWKPPRVVVESRLVSQLPRLCRTFGRFRVGICESKLAAKAFLDAGIRCVTVGSRAAEVPDATHVATWAHVATLDL
jgi:hypothetical protein